MTFIRARLAPLTSHIAFINTAFPAPTLLASAIYGALGCFALDAALLSHTAYAQSAVALPAGAAVKTFEVPAGPLDAALNNFARTAGVNLSYDAALLNGHTCKGLSGQYSIAAALSALLAGSGIEAVTQSGGGYVLRKAPVLRDKDDAVILRSVKITAREEHEQMAGYVAKQSAAGTKTDTPLIETPQSISVVGAQEIETFKPQNLTDALGYVAGIARVEGVDRTTESLLIRGFEAWADNGSIYRDGIKYGVNINNGKQEPYGLERIEVLKGAASVLYGAAAPGGIINTVSKRPTNEPLHEINVEAGSFDRKQISGDFGGALDDDNAWSYRFTFLNRDSDSFVDHVPDDRAYVAPAIKWQPSESTSLTLLSEYQRDKTAYVYALPVEGTVAENPNGEIARDRFQGEPGFDKYDNKRASVGYIFEHEFNDQLKLRQTVRHFWQSNARPFIYSTIWTGDLRSVERAAVDAHDRSRATTADTSLQYSWSSGSITHATLLGVDYNIQRHQQKSSTADVAPLDLFTPGYGSAIGAMTAAGTRKNHDKRAGLYLQDQMKIDGKWVLLLGGRQDWSDNDSKPASADNWTREDTNAFAGRAGLVYLADNGLAPFFSYSQSFEPTSGLDRNNDRFDPSRGEQSEAGLRYQPADSETLISANIYELKKKDVMVTDPVDPDYSVQLGEVRSKGFELEARTRVAQYTNLIAAYTYTDARNIRSSPVTPEMDGLRTGGVPYNQASLWSEYDFAGSGLAGLRAGVGVRYVGSTAGSYVTAEVPSFTLLDAMISYNFSQWRLAMNASNLTDKDYVASCTYGCFYGEPRRIIVSATYLW